MTYILHIPGYPQHMLSGSGWDFETKRLATQLIREVAAASGVTVPDIKGARRSVDLVYARAHIAFVLKARGLTFPQIGRLLGNRDHTTVMNYMNRPLDDWYQRAAKKIAKNLGVKNRDTDPTDASHGRG
jgi:chromosomal replication initiation ATPase DnaA